MANNVLPETDAESLPASLQDPQSGHYAYVSHFGLLKAGDTKPIVAANFAGDNLNRTLWTEQSTAGGNVSLAQGVGNLNVSATGDREILLTRKTGRFVAGQVTVFQTGVFPVGAGTTGNVREWGLASKDLQQKLIFRLNGTALEIVTVRDGVENVIPAASFSEEPAYTVADQNRTWRIDYSAGRALFFDAAGGERRLLHVEVDSQAPLVNGLDLHGYYSNENVTNNTAVSLAVRGSSISIWSQLPLTDILFQRDHLDDGVLPSGPAYVIPEIPDATPPANVVDSGWIRRDEALNALNFLKGDTALQLFIGNANNEFGEGAEGLVVANLQNPAGQPRIIGSPLLGEYVRFVLVNTSGSDATVYSVNCRKQNEPISPIVLSLDQFIVDAFFAPLVQSVGKGKNPNGLYTSTRQQGEVAALSLSSLTDANPATVTNTSWFYWAEFSGLFYDFESDGSATITAEFSDDVVDFNSNGTPSGTLPVANASPIVKEYNTPNETVTRSVPKRGRWVRLSVTNGAAGNTSVVLSADMRIGSHLPTMQEVREPIKENNLAILVRSVETKAGDIEGNVTLPLQLDGLTAQTVLLDLTTIDPTFYGFPAGTILKYVAQTFDLSSTNVGYIEGRYAISDAGDAKVRRSINRRSVGAGVTYEGRQYTPEITPEFGTSVRLDYSQGAGNVAVTGRIDGYLTEA